VVRGRTLSVVASLGGLIFVVLFVIGNILLQEGPSESSPAKMQAYYGSSSHRDRMSIGWALAALGLFFLLWFVAYVRELVRGLETTDSGRGSGFLSSVVAIGGTVYAAVTAAAVGLAEGVRTMSDDTYRHTVYSGVIHAANDGTYVMHATGTIGMAAFILAFSLAVLSAGRFPRWLAWFGVVAAVAALLSIFFVTIIVWLVWLAVTSVVLFAAMNRELGAATRT
jgi:hypothetical protein